MGIATVDMAALARRLHSIKDVSIINTLRMNIHYFGAGGYSIHILLRLGT